MTKRIQSSVAMILLFMVIFAVVDTGVSIGLGWDGVVKLAKTVQAAGEGPPDVAAAHGAGGQGAAVQGVPVQDAAVQGATTVAPPPSASDKVQVEGIVVLIVLALLMYTFASVALAQAWSTALARPPVLTADHVAAIGLTLRMVDPGEPTDDADALVEKPVRDHATLRQQLSPTTPGPVRVILGRLGPRDLLGYAPMEQALASGVQSRWREAVMWADQVDAIGQICAVAGLASTVAGLIVAGARLGSVDHVGLALSGALLKCLIGMVARLGCLWASHLVYKGAREEEEAVLGARWRHS